MGNQIYLINEEFIHGPFYISVERFQLNDLTAYVDASNVYVSTDIKANALRTYRDGLLKTSVSRILRTH